MANQVDICNLALDMLGDNPIASISESSKPAGLLSRSWNYALDEVLRAHTWRFARKHAELEYTAGFGIYQTSDEKDITGITQDDPAIVTVASHGWQTGYQIYIDDVSGMSELNERIFRIERLTTNSFSLLGIDSTVYTTYSSGGTAIRCEANPDYHDGYTYDLPDDYLCDPSIYEHPDIEFEIVGWDDGSNKTHRLLTTLEDAVLEYTSTMTVSDVAKFPAHFIRALAATLARMIHRPLSKKGGKDTQEIWAEYSAVMASAIESDIRGAKEEEGNYKDPILNAGGYE
jgi:hypothetical protein